MGVMEASEEGTTTSLSNTSVEKVVMAALLDGRRVSVDGAGSTLDIAVDRPDPLDRYISAFNLYSPCTHRNNNNQIQIKTQHY